MIRKTKKFAVALVASLSMCLALTACDPVLMNNGDVWTQLADCESSMTNANTGNGYYGYFQFSPTTWRGLGYEGMPTDHSYTTQRQAAIDLQARSGWGQWPGCSRQLGLR